MVVVNAKSLNSANRNNILLLIKKNYFIGQICAILVRWLGNIKPVACIPLLVKLNHCQNATAILIKNYFEMKQLPQHSEHFTKTTKSHIGLHWGFLCCWILLHPSYINSNWRLEIFQQNNKNRWKKNNSKIFIVQLEVLKVSFKRKLK